MHGHGKYTFLNLPKDNVFEGNFIEGEAEGEKEQNIAKNDYFHNNNMCQMMMQHKIANSRLFLLCR